MVAIITITTAEELSNIRLNLGEDYALGNDIDLSTIANWEPIGTLANPFTGALDGNGHTISNLTINRPTEDNVGLFGKNGVIHVALDSIFEVAKKLGYKFQETAATMKQAYDLVEEALEEEGMQHQGEAAEGELPQGEMEGQEPQGMPAQGIYGMGGM